MERPALDFESPEHVVERAVRDASCFMARLYCGQHVGFARFYLTTLQQAREAARLLGELSPISRRANVYALSREGVATLVPDKSSRAQSRAISTEKTKP